MIPRATYRLQFHKDFTFADAEAIVPYLHRLGISHIYASPITTAAPGSTHGYDVVDPTRRAGGDVRALTIAGHGAWAPERPAPYEHGRQRASAC